jgi:hypothetical protein
LAATGWHAAALSVEEKVTDATHAVHWRSETAVPSTVAPKPTGHVDQIVHGAPTAVWYVPLLHVVHAVACGTDGGSLLRSVPSGQVMQLVAPVFGWNVPTPHSAHATASAPDSGLLVRRLPAAHGTQLAAPTAGW